MTTLDPMNTLKYSAIFAISLLAGCGQKNISASGPMPTGLDFDTSLQMGKHCATEKADTLTQGRNAERTTCVTVGMPSTEGYPVEITQQGEQFFVHLSTLGKPDEQFLRLGLLAVLADDQNTRPAPERGSHVVTLQLRKRAGVSVPGRVVFDGALSHLIKNKFDQWLWPASEK